MRSIKLFCTSCFGRRKRILLPLVLLATFICWSLSRDSAPRIPNRDLEHFRRNRSLKYYLDNVGSIQILIEPSAPCGNLEEIPVVVVVTSAPTRFQQRDAIRQTWGRRLHTYFVMGLHEDGTDEQLINNYIEAKQHSDIVVFDFEDHHQNQTLKTGLILQWIEDRCPMAQFLFKTDDDVVVNPWIMELVLKENEDAKLVGYALNNTEPQREEHSMRYLPRWLYPEDEIPQYLSGSGYLISGDYIKKVLRAGYQVPMINLEDIYFTFLVAKDYLRYSLTHDTRLTPYKPWPPWFPFKCAYWVQAVVHGLDSIEIIRIWSKIEVIGKEFESNKDVCAFYSRYSSSFVYLS